MWHDTGTHCPFSRYFARGVAFPDECQDDLKLHITDCYARGGNLHLAIFAPIFLDALIDGSKTIESRFSQNRTAPWGRVSAGDLILCARPGTEVVAVFVASNVEYYDLVVTPIATLVDRYSDPIASQLDPDFWERRMAKKYATFIGVRDVSTVLSCKLRKRDQRGWVCFERADPRLI